MLKGDHARLPLHTQSRVGGKWLLCGAPACNLRARALRHSRLPASGLRAGAPETVPVRAKSAGQRPVCSAQNGGLALPLRHRKRYSL